MNNWIVNPTQWVLHLSSPCNSITSAQKIVLGVVSIMLKEIDEDKEQTHK